MQVLVRDNNVDQALKALKKKMQREGLFREMKLRNYYEKPSEKRAREKAEAIRRARKLARKRAQREGLIAATAAPRDQALDRVLGERPGAGASSRADALERRIGASGDRASPPDDPRLATDIRRRVGLRSRPCRLRDLNGLR